MNEQSLLTDDSMSVGVDNFAQMAYVKWNDAIMAEVRFSGNRTRISWGGSSAGQSNLDECEHMMHALHIIHRIARHVSYGGSLAYAVEAAIKDVMQTTEADEED